nr:uncharacterized protein LOC111415549 [Onthophagus taurus]
MDPSDTALYLQKIEELVYDHGDIITPTLLSAKWDINVSDARSLIEQYVKDTRKSKGDDLAATYVLIGTNTAGNVCFEVVKENELIGKKKLLKNVISEFINSIQKSKDIELNALAILEPIGAFSMRDKPLLGSIVSRNAVKRNFKAKLTKDIPRKEVLKEVKKDEEQSRGNKGIQKNGGLSNFIVKDTNKSAVKPPIPPKAKPKNLIASFLSKQPSKPNIKQPENTIQDAREKKPDILHQVNESNLLKKNTTTELNKKHKLIDTDSDEEVPVSKIPKTKTPKQKRKKRNAKDKGNQENKRRRIITQDSDSDDMFACDDEKMSEDEDIITSDQEAPPPKLVVPSKRKVRKAVTELVEDGDGYFKTVNTFTYESASDEEQDEKQNNQNDENKEIKGKVQDNVVKNKNVSPPRTVKNGKGKIQKLAQNQKSITSFFNKK